MSQYLWRYRRLYLVGGLCLFGTATLVMWIPWWIREAVRIIEHGGSMGDITYYAVLIIAAAVTQGVVRTYSRALIFNAGRTVEYDLRNDLFAHLQKLPLSFYQTQRTGDLMSRVINDISAVRIMLGPGILNFVNAPLYYVYAVALMLSMDVRMTLAALAPFPLLMFVAHKFRGRIMKSSLEVQQQMSVLSSHVQENLSGMHVVKAYSQEPFQTQQFTGLNKDYEIKSLEMAKMRGIVNPVMQGINGLTVLVVIWYGGVRVLRGDLLVADIVAFIAYLNVLAWPTAAFGWMLSLVERGRAAMRRLEEILETTPEIADQPTPQIASSLKQGIEFRDVSFAYDESHPVLRDVSFAIEPGTRLGIAGPTGAGKTTLVSLITRFYDPDAGHVLLDGVDLREYRLADLRRQFAIVLQEPVLFSTTIGENIAYSDPDAEPSAIVAAARAANAHDFISALPEGYETQVGEQGVLLSGGERQRIALARAFLKDAPLLILDEPTSSVDVGTEAVIMEAMERLMHGRTTFMIAHRLSTLDICDARLELEDGRVASASGLVGELPAPR
jgi:ABC-type multidrug transport system fused ATPase/permease subunit